MNSHDYEVIKNIQNAEYEGRKYYSDIYTPEFSHIAKGHGWFYQKVTGFDSLSNTFSSAMSANKPAMIEIDMPAIGPFARAFGGPPVKQED